MRIFQWMQLSVALLRCRSIPFALALAYRHGDNVLFVSLYTYRPREMHGPPEITSKMICYRSKFWTLLLFFLSFHEPVNNMQYSNLSLRYCLNEKLIFFMSNKFSVNFNELTSIPDILSTVSALHFGHFDCLSSFSVLSTDVSLHSEHVCNFCSPIEVT